MYFLWVYLFIISSAKSLTETVMEAGGVAIGFDIRFWYNPFFKSKFVTKTGNVNWINQNNMSLFLAGINIKTVCRFFVKNIPLHPYMSSLWIYMYMQFKVLRTIRYVTHSVSVLKHTAIVFLTGRSIIVVNLTRTPMLKYAKAKASSGYTIVRLWCV